MEYRIGFVDDFEDMIEKYIKKFRRSDIEVIYADDCLTFEDIFEWILDKKINYLLVDYKLQQKYDFSGSELIRYINNKLPDLHCIIFSSVNDINDDLVMKNTIKDKSIIELKIDDPKYKEFIEEIKDGARVFEARKQVSLEEYKNLLNIKNTSGFKNVTEENKQLKDKLSKIETLIINHNRNIGDIYYKYNSKILKSELKQRILEIVYEVSE